MSQGRPEGLRYERRSARPFEDVTALLKQAVAEQKIAGAVAAVAHHGKAAYRQAVGVQDLQTRAPMTERSLFRIYSMTKPVTAAAVMMLHEAGRFSLTDPVSRYLWQSVPADPGGLRGRFNALVSRSAGL